MRSAAVWTSGVVLASAALFSACQHGMAGGLAPAQKTVHIPHQALQDKISSRFPITRQVMGVASVTLSQPQIALLPQDNRLSTRLHMHIPSVLGITPALSGQIQMQYGLHYDPQQQAVLMRDVLVQSVQMQDSQGQQHAWLNAALAVLGAQVLQQMPLYTLRPSDTALLDATGYQPAHITIRDRGLDIVLQRGTTPP